MLMECGLPTVWDLLKGAFNFLKDPVVKTMSSKRFADDLRAKVQNLENVVEKVHILEIEAGNNNRILLHTFTDWKESADKTSTEARNRLKAFEEDSKSCCYERIPRNPYGSYKFSTEAQDQIQVIQNLAKEGEGFEGLNDISCVNPTPGSVDPPIQARRGGEDVVVQSSTAAAVKLRDDSGFESRASVLQNIMDALASNSVVGVHGMGGVGKSTLLVDAEKRIREQKSFHCIAKADVSENPEIMRIQGEIAHWLGLTDLVKEEDVSARANLLRERLEKEEREQKKVLIILDNLWEKLDLKSVGIPCGYGNKAKGCKLLLTSRDEHVLRREMRCDSAFLLGELEKEEARRLLLEQIGEGKVEVEWEPLVEEALRISAGLPFLIVAISNLFIHTTYSDCEYDLKQIWNKDTGKVINNTLQLSYGRISEEAKSVLRLCAAYGVSKPSLDNLVRYGFGLGIFQVSSVQETRVRLSSLIHTLQASSLLLDGEEEADGFKIHDLVREFVASFASTDRPLLILKDKDKWETELSGNKLKNCEAICFPYVDLEELPKELACPQLQMFLLFSINNSLDISDSYFNTATNLLVLDLKSIHLSRSPSPFQFLKNLHSLSLDYCSLEDVAILGELKGLQILSLRGSNIQQLPKEIGQLMELRLLDLDDCWELQVIEPGVLGSLTKLEELYINDSFDKWNSMELTPATNACLIELNNMKKLYTLYVSIPNPSVLPKDLDFEKLTKYRIRIGSAQRLSKYDGSTTLELTLDPTSDVPRKDCISSILRKIEVLFLDGLNGIEQSISALSPEGLPQLKHLEVKHSPSVRYILEWSSLPTFMALETLLLENLVNLEKICHNHISTKSFRTLKVVRVESCHQMEVLFPRSVVRELPQLEEIKVNICESMRWIIEDEDGRGKPELPKLRVLELINLPNIENFFTAGSTPDQVGTQIAFFNGQQVDFPKLETLKVSGLDNLRFIFYPSMVKSLAQLRELSIRHCEKMEAIIMEEEGRGMEASETLTFPMLIDLQLIQLKSLTCFSRGKCLREGRNQDHVQLPSNALFNREVACPSLETLEVSGLDSLMFMLSLSMVKSLGQLTKLEVRGCEKMEAIIVKEEGLGVEISETLSFPMLTDLSLGRLESLTCFSSKKCSQESRSQDHIQSRSNVLFNGEVAFPSLEELRIEAMDNIEMIWNDQVAVDSFSKLNLLYVNKCNKLVNVIPSIVLGQLLGLERLEAKSCGSLEVVFKCHHLNPLDGHSIARSQLKELKLSDLPGLKCVWDKELHHQVKFQCLRSISVSICLSLASLFPASIARDLMQFEELTINECGIVELFEKEGLEEQSINVEVTQGTSHELPFTGYFRHLKALDVSYCRELSNMFTPTMATNFVGLTKLRISKCGLLTEVISDDGNREGHVVAFNQLKYIELDGLIGLRCFYSGGYTLMFPLLEEVIVNGCPKMKFFSEGPIEASKLEKVQISKEASLWKGNLNITIENMFEEMGSIGGVTNMLLSEFPELIEKWHSKLNFIKSSWQLKSLTVDKCPSFINAIPSRLMVVLERMNTLQVRDCESLEEIFDLQGLEAMDNTRVLYSFRTLDLVNLPKLRRLWNKDLQGTMRFNCLSFLTLYKCSHLRHIFTPSMALCLAELLSMKIEECGQLEAVIVEEEGQGSAMEKSTIPRLIRLTLECLPNFTSFLVGKNHMLECPELAELTISHCPKMRSLAWQSLKEIDDGTPSLFTPQVQFPQLGYLVLSHMDNLSKLWVDGPQETFPFDYLWKVEVQNCKRLENLFPYEVATSLNQLGNLRVESCGIQEIVANGDDTSHSATAQVIFPELISLVLHDMPQLKSFYPNLATLNWPFLEELRVTHCDKLNMLSFAASMSKWTETYNLQDLSNQEAQTTFERDFLDLKRLLLVEKDIQRIQNGNFPDDIFDEHEALTLACFHDENAVFPSKFLLERFQNLESLEVFCGSFEDIFPDERLVDDGKHPVFESLRELKLSRLHKLKRVWKEDHLVSKVLESITRFEVWDCPCLTTIFPATISFRNLMELVVKNSSGLVHLGTVSAVASLVNLTEMTIIGCERMKEVVANDENGETKVISFENLCKLTLQNMASLECFSSITSCILRFPSLDYIEVEECPKMNIFSKGTLSTPRLEYVSLFRYGRNGDWEEGDDLNATIKKLST